MAWLMIPATIGPIVGPPVGGFIVTYLSWHWIFYINVPIGIAGIVLVTRYIEEMREPTRTPFDLLGLILAGAALMGLELPDLAALAADPSVPPLVLVTHHLEEIPAGVTHAALLREGSMVAAGPIDAVLTGEAVSAAFGVDVAVERRGGRWSARSVSA